MKKKILSLLVLLMAAVSGAWAQTETLADGSYYVKNGALSLYMAAGGNWGTQGIVNERGLDLIFTYNSGTKTYTIDSRLDNGDNHFLDTGLHMDAPSFGWTVEGENSFTISAKLDGVKHYLAVDQNNILVFTEDGTAENAQWIIIPKADNENAVLTAGLDAMKAATAGNGVDATFLIACPGFNRNDNRNAEAWTVEANRLQMGGAGSEGNGCAESYNSTFTLSQTLSNAPAGVYTLTAQGFYKQNGSDNENLPYFYANDEKQTFKLLEDQVSNMSDAGPLFTQGKYTIDPITVVVAEDGALTIGAKLETNTRLWSCWDNFKLTYYGPLMYSVTQAEHGSGTISYTVQDKDDAEKIMENAKGANEGDLVTVTVTADEGYVVGSVTASTYATWEAAGARRKAPAAIPMLGDVTLTPVEGKANTWTFTMPAANVQVSATYIPVAAFAPAEPSGTLAPTAAEGVIAGEDKAIIVAGTVANIPETTNPQGTVKYFVTDNKDMTAEQAAEANGWVEALPTAAGYTGSYADDFQVYVWYYIQAATGYADSEPQRIEVTVQSNLFDLTLKAANANTIDATQASKGTVSVKEGTGAAVDKTSAITDEGKLEGIKMGSEVKLNAKQGYKFRKVEVKKGAPDVKITSFSLQGPSSLGDSDSNTISIVNIVPSNATNQTFTWSTSGDISITGVSNDTKTCDVMSGSSTGNASVTATANDGSGVSYTLNITLTGEI